MALNLSYPCLPSGIGWEAGAVVRLLQELVEVMEDTAWCPEGKPGVADKSLQQGSRVRP